MSSEDDDMDCIFIPDADTLSEQINKPNISAASNSTLVNSGIASSGIPSLSKDKYIKVYDHFQQWTKKKGRGRPISEDLVYDYFLDLSSKSKPSTMWVYYSMLKGTLRCNDNVEIGEYTRVIDFLKEKNAGYKPTRATVFTDEEIEKFINEAPDEYWLDVKVVCIFSINGASSTNKLINFTTDHIKQYDDLILVTVPKVDTSAKRTFTLTGTFFHLVKSYIALRPSNTRDKRFFIHYHQGKCTIQPIGKNKFYEMARKIAKYLKLPEPERYSAHSFRRSSTSLVATNGNYYSAGFAEQETHETETSLDYETGNLETSTISYMKPIATPPKPARTMNDGTPAHICTLICGHVKCAFEENEHSALHAFSVLKPPDYNITEICPALFPSVPTCRWIVGYTHITEPVLTKNAEETFEEITSSIPNNVRIVQKYVRRNSTQLFAAYVVVYGVNCRCHKQSSNDNILSHEFPQTFSPGFLPGYSLSSVKYEV